MIFYVIHCSDNFQLSITFINRFLDSRAFIKNFSNDEDGAVTVDFVVLTAAIVVLGLAVGTAVSNGATGLANKIENSLKSQSAGG